MSFEDVKRFLGLRDRESETRLRAIAQRRKELCALTDGELKSAARALGEADVIETFALAAAVAQRVLGQRMFDVQILGALAMQRGQIAEM